MSLKGSVTGVNRSRPTAHPKASSRPRGSKAAGLSLAALSTNPSATILAHARKLNGDCY